MRILLTGENGQLGFELHESLVPLGEITAVGRTQCDLSNPDAIRALIRQVQPQIIVNPAAYTAVDKAESDIDLAMSVNATAPGVIGEEAEKIGALVVHFSTDYVFDGKKQAPYSEDDLPNPQSAYGASKLAGEKALQAVCGRHLILRTSWLVGAHGGNFAKTMLRLAAERESLDVVADQWGAPTSASLVAAVTALLLRDALRMPHTFRYGLYHLSASGRTNWHAYACHVIERARSLGRPVRVTQDSIRAVNTGDYPMIAARPANSQLDTSRLRKTFGFNLPDWTWGVNHVLDQILQT